MIVFSLAVGILPFDGEDEKETASNIVNGNIRWESKYAKNLNSDARHLITSKRCGETLSRPAEDISKGTANH